MILCKKGSMYLKLFLKCDWKKILKKKFDKMRIFLSKFEAVLSVYQCINNISLSVYIKISIYFRVKYLTDS